MKETLKNKFEAASTELGFSNDFNVYTEADLRESSTLWTRPFITLIDSLVGITEQQLPLIAIETQNFYTRGLQLGSNPVPYVFFRLHIIGRSRGERDDLVGSIVKNITDITIYSFTDPSSPTASYTTALFPIRGTDLWAIETIIPNENLAIEATFRNWCTAETSCWLTGA